jgi:hypothetical protein
MNEKPSQKAMDIFNRRMQAAAPFEQEYQETVARIDAEYDQAVAPDLEHYRAVKQSIEQHYLEAIHNAQNKEEEERISEEWDTALDEAWHNFSVKTNSARTKQSRGREEAQIKLNQATQKAYRELGLTKASDNTLKDE